MAKAGWNTKFEKRRWALVAVAVAALFVTLGAVATSSPATCGLCHSPHLEAAEGSAHASVHCYECHLPDGSWSLLAAKTDELTRMLPAKLIGREADGPVTRTSARSCLRCHQGINKDVITSLGLRIRHASCAKGASCDRCHSGTAHGELARWTGNPVMEDCIGCHTRSGASTDCEACHTGDDEQRQAAAGPWQVTHGADWKNTHGMGRLESCITCHPDDYCVGCHNTPVPHGLDFGRTHGAEAKKDVDGCTVCHDREAFCQECHGIEMPHPAGFKAEHPEIADGTADHSCLKCHADNDCANCHEHHIHPGGSKGFPVPWTLTPAGQR